jgi:ATP-binding protein involved in chromosome partitioning
MSQPTLETLVRDALNRIPDPVSGKGLIDSGRISGLVIRPDGRIGFVLETDRGPTDEPLRAKAESAAASVSGVTGVTAVLTAHGAPPPRAVPPPQKPAPPPLDARKEATRPARTIIAVASAKGGVGKSTVAVNLAVAAARSGLRVGLLDADIFGPSLPTMMGATGRKPELTADRRMIPLGLHGVSGMSIGYLISPDNPIVWRGPMVMSALVQLINDTDWGDLDVLFIDTPPGTGEVQLTLAQRLPMDGVVIVSTPQEVALVDVRRGVAMFRKTAVPVLGIIENMAWFEQADGSRAYIFGEGGAQRTATELETPFLGAIPILPELREGGDAGLPAAAGDGVSARAFSLLAEAVLSTAATAAGKPPPVIEFL